MPDSLTETKQIHFEDVNIGDDLPHLQKGPLTIMHLMRWSAAMENWHRIHYDERFAIEHDKLPGILINGSLKQNFISQLLKDWAGLDGWLWKVSFQFRKMDVAGATLFVWARVVGKTEAPAFGVVRIQLGIVDANGQQSTPGHALVALPYRGGKVPYPFVPPADIELDQP